MLTQELYKAGLSLRRMQRMKTSSLRSAERAGRRGEPSTAVAAALNCLQIPEPGLPDWREWVVLLSGMSRSLPAVEGRQRTILRFLSAQVAVLNARGADTTHLMTTETVDGEDVCRVRHPRAPAPLAILRMGGAACTDWSRGRRRTPWPCAQVDMYKAIESWRAMDRELFQATLEQLLYVKYIGTAGTLDAYAVAVNELMMSYFEEKGEVLPLLQQGSRVSMCAGRAAPFCAARPPRVHPLVLRWSRRCGRGLSAAHAVRGARVRTLTRGCPAGRGRCEPLQKVSQARQAHPHSVQVVPDGHQAQGDAPDPGPDCWHRREHGCRRLHHDAGARSCPLCLSVSLCLCLSASLPLVSSHPLNPSLSPCLSPSLSTLHLRTDCHE